MERSDMSVPFCAHTFVGGLCSLCLCPENPEHYQRAANAIANAEALLAQGFSEVLQRWMSREEAIFEAWRSYHARA